MDILKRKWPGLLACGIGLLALLSGIYCIRAESKTREASVRVRGMITEINPLNQRIRKGTNRLWIKMKYIDSLGSENHALASVRLSTQPAEGDSVTALFEPGKKSARIIDWRDWMTGASLAIIGVWFIAIGIFIRNLLGPRDPS